MSLALSTRALIISLLQLVNGPQLLNIIFLLVLFALSASEAAVLLTEIVPLTRMYASL